MAFTISAAQLFIELEDGLSYIATEDGGDLLLETAGAALDLTAYLMHDSMNVKFNTIDFTLLDPGPGAIALGAAVTTTDPAWTGTVASVMTSDPVDLRNGHVFYTVAATNAKALPTDTAPFDLSDVPSVSPPFDYLLEDGSGHYLIETGTDFAPGALMLEGALAYSYAGLSVQTRVNANGPNTTLGRCTVFQPGLRPGNTFALTSLNQGYSAASFRVTQVNIRWPQLAANPVFDVEFGDTLDTLALWTQVTAPATIAPQAAPVVIPSGPVIFGNTSTGHVTYAMGGATVTIATATFSVSAPVGHTLTVQVLGAIDARMIAWDNYVSTPRRGVRAVLSGGIYTGAWQELPFGLARATYDLSSAPGIALASGTYTVSIQINTVEYNQMEVFSGWVQAAVVTV